MASHAMATYVEPQVLDKLIPSARVAERDATTARGPGPRRTLPGRRERAYLRGRVAVDDEVTTNANRPAQSLYLSTVPKRRRVSREVPRTRETSRESARHHSRARVLRRLETPSRYEVSDGPYLPDPHALPGHGSDGCGPQSSDPRAPRLAPRVEQLAVGVPQVSSRENSERPALITQMGFCKGVGGPESTGLGPKDRRAGTFARPQKSARGKVDAQHCCSCKAL
jgi:hypothetical protein